MSQTFTVFAQGASQTAFLKQIGATAFPNGDFFNPFGVAVDSNKNLYVADTDNNRIQVFDSAGNFKFTFGSIGSGNSQFFSPFSIAVDNSQNIYVIDNGNNRVQVFDSAGNFKFKFGSSGSGNGQFSSPEGIGVDSSQNIYVADMLNHRVQIFDSDGTFLAKYGTAGTGPGQFTMLRRVAITPGAADPDIYLADLWGYKVDQIAQDDSLDFTYTRTFGGAPPADGLFNEPSGLSVDPLHIYVADSVNQRLQRFDTATGTFQLKWGERGWGGDLLGFNWPRDLTLSPVTNTIWVADTKNGCTA